MTQNHVRHRKRYFNRILGLVISEPDQRVKKHGGTPRVGGGLEQNTLIQHRTHQFYTHARTHTVHPEPPVSKCVHASKKIEFLP